MRLREIMKLGGTRKSGSVMTSKVMIATGDTSLTEFSEKLWRLITETDYLRPSVYGVVVEGLTHKESSETYDVKESYLRNLIGIEGRRLEEDLGMDVLPYLQGEGEKLTRNEISALNMIVEGLLEVVEPLEEGVFDKLNIDIRDTRAVRNTDMSDGDFIKGIQSLEMLSKPKLESAITDAGDELIGYIVHILRTDEKYLTESDKTRKEILEEVWWL